MSVLRLEWKLCNDTQLLWEFFPQLNTIPWKLYLLNKLL